MPDVSIIVPVYNVEKFLAGCIDSILSQTYKNIEVILVDDGSTDGSGVICDEYAAKDSRIQVFHKENGGVASARQLGMDNARGEYVIHCDPDDYVEPSMLEKLYICAKEENADVVICDFYVNHPDREYIVRQQPSSNDHLTALSELFQQLHGSCCNKLVRRACYKQYDISFPKNVSYCEDLSFWTCLFKYPVKIAYLPEAFYHYVQHDTSIVHSYMNKKEDDGWKLMRLLHRELKSFPEIRKKAQERTAFVVVNDAYKYGDFNSITFFRHYARYVPYLLKYKTVILRERLFYARVCLGFYSYYKFRQK